MKFIKIFVNIILSAVYFTVMSFVFEFIVGVFVGILGGDLQNSTIAVVLGPLLTLVFGITFICIPKIRNKIFLSIS